MRGGTVSLITVALILLVSIVQSVRLNNDITIERSAPATQRENIWLTAGLTCDLCELGVSEIQRLIKSDRAEDDIANIIVGFCSDLKIEKPEVCSGLVNLFRNETFTVLGYSGVTPAYFCGFLAICPYNPANFTGIVQFPKPKPPHVAPIAPAKGAPTKKILHISDLHIDTLYTEGSTNDCGMPICCRAANGPGATPQTTAGKWGDYQCDINLLMANSMLEFISREFEDLDYIIWTGDNPPHDIWMQSHETQLNASSMITDLLKKYFPLVQVIPCIGNHEGVPVNSFPLPGQPGSTWLFDGLSQYWQDWLQDYPETLETLQYGGYYVAKVEPGLQMMVLNMNWCNNINMWLIENVTDPASQLAWAIDTLQAAEDAGDKVYVIGHIPPGVSDCIDLWSQQFYQVVNRYEDTIVSQFYGHTHRDHFQVFYTQDDERRPTSVAHITPSTTTYQDQNPAFRIFTVDADSYYLMEISTYHADLAAANLNDAPVWTLEYNASISYDMKSLFPADWNAVIANMTENPIFFNDFYNFYFSSSSYPIENPCDETCQISYICHLEAGYSNLYNECVHKKLLEKSPSTSTYLENYQSFIDHITFKEKKVC